MHSSVLYIDCFRLLRSFQVSTLGEEAAAAWLLAQARGIAAAAAAGRPDLEVVAEREQTTGAIGRQAAFAFEIANV